MTTKAKSAARQDLLDAADAGDADMVSRLIREGNNPNFSSENGWTPLMLAAMHSPLRIVELLLESGADPNLATDSQENSRRTPLAVAVSNGRPDAVNLLLAYHADTAVTDANGMTALELARKLALRPFKQEAMQSIISFLSEAASPRSPNNVLTTSAA